MTPTDEGSLRPERFRDYLLLLARTQIGPGLRGRLDPSDAVQEALLEAHRQRDRFEGTTEAQMAAWLTKILQGRLVDLLRAHGRQRRDARRDRSIEATLDSSASRLAGWIASREDSPSQAARYGEAVLRLSEGLEDLPADQREAVFLRYFAGMPVETIAAELDRSVVAVTGLLKRGARRLRELLEG